MIKKYFTDGLIGLAILLSLFRSDLDLVNLNNLINYPEVQDIIQGQTAAYLPSNFHHLPNTLYGYSNQKHLDLDVNSEAFTSWFNNLNIGLSNIPHSQLQDRQNDIEAFLVSGTTIVNTRVQEIVSSTNSAPTENSVTPSVSSPTLPEEGANSYPELSIDAINNTASQNATNYSSPSASGSSSEQTPVVVDVSFLCNNPFPGCNLTIEDLQLIDVLWRQDEDLGVGKEVYDANLRLEMEKKQEMERIRLQEMQKEQRLAKEKEEREKHEQASKWLKENFRRDGETGEWVCVQDTANAVDENGSAACMTSPDSGNDEFPTLESALDYILNVDPDVLAGTCESVDNNQTTNCQTTLLANAIGEFHVEEPVQQQNHQLQLGEHQQQNPQQLPVQQPLVSVEHQDSLEESWSGLVNYLNLTESAIDAAVNECCQSSGNNDTTITNPNNEDNNFTIVNCRDESNLLFRDNMTSCQSLLLPEGINTTTNTDIFSTAGYAGSSPSNRVGPVTSDSNMTLANSSGLDDRHSSYLLNNASMPAENTNMTAELMTLASASEKVAEMGSVNSSAPSLVTSQTSLQTFPSSELNSLNLDNIGGFFEDLAGLDDAGVEDLNMEEIDNMLHTIQSAGPQLLEPIMNLGDNMDTLQKLGDELNQSMGNASSLEDYDALEELEGATGGYDGFDTHNQLRNLKDASRHSRPKTSRFSESSSDSGYAYNKAGSPASSSFSNSSSNNGSYAGSPSGSHHGSDDGLHHHSDHHQHQRSGKNILHSAYNISTSSNGTEHDPHGSRTLAQHQVAHNHTYNTPPGQVPREVKKYAQKEPSRKGPHSRDQRRAAELKIPFTLDEIIDSPVETFNDMISSHKLNETQLSLIRDIRRRGKNKVAAQNCRKRKVNVIVNLSDERSELEKARDRLIAERAAMDRETRRVRAKFGHLYASIFQSLRDEQGRPYDPNLYSLQQSSDGNVFLVPRNMTNSSSPALASVPFTVASPSSRDLSLPSASFLPLSPSASNGGSSSHFLGLAGGSTGTSSAASSASSSPSATSTSPPSPSVSTSKRSSGISASKKRKTFDE